MRKAAGLLVLALACSAYADPSDADKLRAQGEAAAKRGEYAQAIEAFKDADRKDPQARHACMIGLTYLRRNLVGQAEIFLQRCRKRARASEKLPAWVDAAEKQLRDTLANGAVTTIEIVVTPASAAASVTVSGFAPDESFDPQTIHLPAGAYTITVAAPGYPDNVKQVTATGNRETIPLSFVLEQAKPVEPTPTVTPPVEPSPVPPPASPPIEPRPVEPTPIDHSARSGRSPAAVPLMITGGIVAAGAVALHIGSWRFRVNNLDDKNYSKDTGDRYDTLRISTFTLYGSAAIVGGIGTYLFLRGSESSTRVAAVPLDGGGMLTIGWQR